MTSEAAWTPGRSFFYITIFTFVLLGVYNVLHTFETSICEKTYSYDTPQYMEIDLPEDIQLKFPKYRLIIYSEGTYAKDIASQSPTGIPVLYIPGNAGSFKQVGPLASVAHKKVKDNKINYHFNYYVLDFQEELSGIFGGVLKYQTEFAHFCVKHILSLYKQNVSRTSVVLVGHSMGGIIARSLFAMSGFDPKMVHTVITQATPHQEPVINIDFEIADYYNHVNEYWTQHKNTTLKHVTVFATGGGFRDALVRNDLTDVNGLVLRENSISVSSMSMPLVWATTDHNCHVWCKQLVMAITRAMFDCVDKYNKQLTDNPVYRISAFHHHFVQNYGSEHFNAATNKHIIIDVNAMWEIKRKQSWTFFRENVSFPRYLVVELPSEMKLGYIAMTNLKLKDWVGVCFLKEKQNNCSELTNLSPQSELIPPLYSDRKVIHIESNIFSGNTHLVHVLPKGSQNAQVFSDLYEISERHITHNVTTFKDFAMNLPLSVTSDDIIINNTERGSIFYNVTLSGLTIPLQAYTLNIINLGCDADKLPESYPNVLVKLFIPWNHEHAYHFIKGDANSSFLIKLQSGKPYDAPYPQLHFYLQPSCSYRITSSIAWIDLVGQFMRFYGVHLIGFFAIQIMMVLSYQLRTLDSVGTISGFFHAHVSWAQPWRVNLVAMLLKLMFIFPREASFSDSLGLPQIDVFILEKSNTNCTMLSLMLYVAATSVVQLVGFMAIISVKACTIFLSPLLRYCDVSVRGIFAALQYLSLMVALILSITVCGTLGIGICVIVFFLKTVYSSWKSRDEGVDSLARQQEESRSNIFNTIMLLILIVFLINLPSFIHWYTSLAYWVNLQSDPSMITGALCAISCILIAVVDFPSISSKLFRLSSSFVYIACVLMVLYCHVSVYRINYFVCFALLVCAIPGAVIGLLMKPEATPASMFMQATKTKMKAE